MLQFELIPAPARTSRRLLVMLHGLGDSSKGYYWLPQALRLPWLNYALVNAPDEYYGGYSWYDFAHDPRPGVLRSRNLLTAVLDHFAAQGFPREAITLGGFSQGCLMTLECGLRYPHRLAGILGISGYVLDVPGLLHELSPVAKAQRIFVSHGTQDPIVPFGRTRDQVQQLQTAGLAIAWHEFPKAHTILEEELLLIREFIVAGYPTERAD